MEPQGSIESDSFNVTGFGRGCKSRTVSQIWNEAQKRTLTFVPGSIVKVCRPVSRVEMNAKKNGALDTALHTKEILCALFPKNGQKRV
jgi:hypothetical protein